MKRYNILVPTDFSSESKHAFELAKQLGHDRDVTINLVHFLKSPMPASFNVTGEVGLTRDTSATPAVIGAVQETDKKLSSWANEAPSLEIKKTVEDDFFDSGIKSFVDKNDIDLILMGTTGETDWMDIFRGNHAEQAISMVGCPVITLKSDTTLEQLQNIALAVDLDSDAYEGKVISKMMKMVDLFQAKLRLVYVDIGNRDLEELTERLKDFANRNKINYHSISAIRGISTEDGIKDFCSQMKAGLVAILTNSSGGFFRWFEDSTAANLSKDAEIPVMSINEENA
ncbi:MAG: universal stress protein [Cyclobacteriaceae bacterium]